MEWQNDAYRLSDDPCQLDLEIIHQLLKNSYWAARRTRETTEKCLRHSLNFGLYHGSKQIGFARVITDYTTHSYLCDVIVAPDHRRRGLGTWMLQCIMAHPDLSTTRMDLFTKDAQAFYAKLGYAPHRFDCLVHYPPTYAGGSDHSPAL